MEKQNDKDAREQDFGLRVNQLSHFEWKGDTLIEDTISKMVDEHDKVIWDLVSNRYDIDFSDLARWARRRQIADRPMEVKRLLGGVVIRASGGREYYVSDIPAFESVASDVYNKITTIHNATVTIWENTHTGDISFGWSGGEDVLVEGDCD